MPAAGRQREGQVRDRAEEEEERNRRPDRQLEQRPLGGYQRGGRGVEAQEAADHRRCDQRFPGERDREDRDSLDRVKHRQGGVPSKETPGPLRGDAPGRREGPDGAG